MLLSLHVDDDAHSHIRRKLWPGCVLGVYMYIYVGDMSMFSDILNPIGFWFVLQVQSLPHLLVPKVLKLILCGFQTN